MTLTSEIRKGWAASITFHLLLFLLLVLTQVPIPSFEQEYIEVEWGGILGPAPAKQPQPQAGETSAQAAEPMRKTSVPVRRSNERTVAPASTSPVTPVRIPERRTRLEEEDVVPVPSVEKRAPELDGTTGISAPARTRPSTTPEASGVSTRSGGARSAAGTLPGASGLPQGVAGQSGSLPGTGLPTEYAIEWSGGGTRRMISGDIPKYPEGVRVSAQIRVNAVVTPAGLVRSVVPVQKGNRLLEDAAMNAVRDWKFEPLPISLPQLDQQAVITFQFRLR